MQKHISYTKKQRSFLSQSGFGLLEIVLSVALISISLFALATTARIAFRAVANSSNAVRADFILEEGVESLKTMRDENWFNISSLTAGTTYYFSFSGGKWQATTTPQIVDNIFTRSFVLYQVFRDANYNITPTGTVDASARKAEIDISWQENGMTRTIKAITYITNIFLD